jgi:hypothetical protein
MTSQMISDSNDSSMGLTLQARATRQAPFGRSLTLPGASPYLRRDLPRDLASNVS